MKEWIDVVDDVVLRLEFPQWQGGVNPNYYLGSKLLAFLAPPGRNAETVMVPVSEDLDETLEISDGFFARDALVQQTRRAAAILEERRPDRVIVLGGDCSVSQAPFDYLHGKYPDEVGILWIDAHPDISTPRDFAHEHAMVLGNLLGEGAPTMAGLVRHPYTPDQVLYVGLVADEQLDYEKAAMADRPIRYATPEDLRSGSDRVTDWIRERGIKHVVVHWDLDVLDPDGFASLLCAEPPRHPVDYAVGKLRLDEVIGILHDVSRVADIVGLTLAEFLPWDAINLRRGLAQLEIFQQ